MSPRSPNQRLAHWIDSSGLNHTQLAAKVRDLARDRGQTQVYPDARRVRAWKQGERPRDPVPELLLNILTEHTGQHLTLSDIGLGEDGALPLSERTWNAHVLTGELAALTRSDIMRGETSPASGQLLHGNELLEGVRPWASLPVHPAHARGTRRLGHSDVSRLEALTQSLRSLDNLHGGGTARQAVIGQLAGVTDMLANASYTDEVGRRLFTAVGDLAGVAGWMCHDVGLHSSAQHYFLLALRAAKEAGTAHLGAHILNCMARQASHLEHPDDALELVHLALYGVRRVATPTVRAVLHSLEARAHAMMGHPDEFARSAHQAELAFGDSDTVEEPSWVRFFDTGEYYATIGVCHQIVARVSDPAHATLSVWMMEQAIQARPVERHRSLAFDHIGLARALLVQRETEAALAKTRTALELLPDLASTRVVDRLREVSVEARPFAGDAHADELRDLVNTACARP
ncbi:hypothetical protein AB0I72_19030 [Nocardiopsis sp. NPDC049922]|uniref:hypothetical protein n=1 Tax=Nocardiopsis sp. NPDC049922 TaxID=3155157 RepID=UPI0033E7EC95